MSGAPDDDRAARALAEPSSETLLSGICPACLAPVATLYPPDPRLCYDCQRLRAARLLSTLLGRLAEAKACVGCRR